MKRRNAPLPCSSLQALARSAVADAVGEVDHVLIPDVRREWIDGYQVEIVKVDRVLTVDVGVADPHRDRAGPSADQPWVLVVGLTSQGGRGLFDVDSVEMQHRIGVGLQPADAARGHGMTASAQQPAECRMLGDGLGLK